MKAIVDTIGAIEKKRNDFKEISRSEGHEITD